MQRELPDGSARSQPSSSETISSEILTQNYLIRVFLPELSQLICTALGTLQIFTIFTHGSLRKVSNYSSVGWVKNESGSTLSGGVG